jgi:hypothetical protein
MIRHVLPLLIALTAAISVAPTPADAQDTGSKRQIKSVVELFTSQGCSSCPSADALMEKTYGKRDDVLALSFSVDYWDYIGWKDTNASPRNTSRQREYSKARGDGAVYTPQMVVNGLTHAVGSQGGEIDRAIVKTTATVQPEWLPLTVKPAASGVTVEVDSAGKAAPDTRIILVGIKRRHDVKIERGENAGRSITYTNVVREFKQLGNISATQTSFSIPADQMANAACDAYAVIVQRGAAGRIVGAATIGTW